MSRFDSPLSNVRVASPCSMDWNAMEGDDRKRFCGECRLNVYNLSGMTRYDAENLLRLSEGRLCVRYFERPDGSVLTEDCPVGWALVKRRISVFAAAAFSLVIGLFGSVFIYSIFKRSSHRQVVGAIAIATPTPMPTPVATPTPLNEILGGLALPTPEPKRERQTTPKVRRILPVYPGA